MKDIFNNLGRIETSYLRCDLIDLLYTLRSKYFNHVELLFLGLMMKQINFLEFPSLNLIIGKSLK